MMLMMISTNAQRINGLRIGLNIVPVVNSYLDSVQNNYEVSFDYEVYNKYYAVLEGGFQNLSINKPEYSYNSNGQFFRLGVDYNSMKTAINEYHMSFVGLRYAFSNFSQEFPGLTLHDSYWGDFSSSVTKESRSFHWVELAGGMRGELMKNFFIGWSIRVRVPISKIANFEFLPYSIPGYGNPKSNPAMDINYSIYYKIPLFNKKSDSKPPL